MIGQFYIYYSFFPFFHTNAQNIVKCTQSINNNIDNPQATNYQERFTLLDPFIMRKNGDHHVDLEQNGSTDFIIENPDFNIVEFQSNMVLRWEYKPGSTLFVVWSQNRSGDIPTSDDKKILDY